MSIHSFKHAATLQHTHPNNPHPLLLRVDKKAGHGAGKSVEKKYGFLPTHMSLGPHLYFRLLFAPSLREVRSMLTFSSKCRLISQFGTGFRSATHITSCTARSKSALEVNRPNHRQRQRLRWQWQGDRHVEVVGGGTRWSGW